MKLSLEGFAALIDQTLLKQNITNEDLTSHCKGAIENKFKAVAVSGSAAKLCKDVLRDSGVLLDVAIGFPYGQETIRTKVFEGVDALNNGADEIDYVINIVQAKSGNWKHIEEEMAGIVYECNLKGAASKVIFENCFLTEYEKKKLCDIALEVKPTFIKTSTGLASGGATIEDVVLMKNAVGSELKVKASGGIKSAEFTLRLIEAGAERIGTSSGIQILEEYKLLLAR